MALHIATGGALFSGMALVNLSVVPAFWLGRRLLVRILGLVAAVGFAFVVLSSAPMPLWLYVIWVALAMGSFALVSARTVPDRLRRAKPVLGALLVLVSAAACALEARHWGLPEVAADPGVPVCVVGDSLSAGIGAGTTLWPQVYARDSGRAVVNLAEPGATLKSALRQAAKLPDAPAVVILEIGGNDLLGGATGAGFREDLGRLLAVARGPNRRLVMFELPLPPFHGAFGRAQRSLAAEHGVAMIPKRFLGGIIGRRGATLDGLHFSQAGHDGMATLVRAVVRDGTPAGR